MQWTFDNQSEIREEKNHKCARKKDTIIVEKPSWTGFIQYSGLSNQPFEMDILLHESPVQITFHIIFLSAIFRPNSVIMMNGFNDSTKLHVFDCFPFFSVYLIFAYW